MAHNVTNVWMELICLKMALNVYLYLHQWSSSYIIFDFNNKLITYKKNI